MPLISSYWHGTNDFSIWDVHQTEVILRNLVDCSCEWDPILTNGVLPIYMSKFAMWYLVWGARKIIYFVFEAFSASLFAQGYS